ncbi:Rid family hydrolase [Rhodoferax sp.]|uniref:Rid family hydrolase n=1 Tax=Rhodoferax sp. TaxID=50421 RepID=UPI0026214700|nr:Rid family hydrolase [Rhodoferax sp.]MDD2926221.1 Rid family hydrolase [Rhodoferax sp.]
MNPDANAASAKSDRVRVKAMTPYDDILAFSRVVCLDNEAWVSACAPLDAQGQLVGAGDAYAQADQCIRNITQALAKVAFDASDIVRTRIYLRSFADLDAVARAHREVFAEIRPACAVVAVADLVRPDMLVYIEADARRIGSTQA